MHDDGARSAGYAALATAGAVWGTGFVLGKWALEELSVGQMVLLRFAFASAALLAAVAIESRRAPIRIKRSDLSIILAAAVIGVPIQYLLQFHGLALTTVSHASLMVGVLPVILGAAAALFGGERLDWIGWVALVASTCGAALVAFGGTSAITGGPSLYGDLLVVVSLFAGVVWIMLSQRLMKNGNSSVMTSAAATILGTVFLACWILPTEGLPAFGMISARTWLSLGVLGVVVTAVTTLLWNWGLARVPASQAGVFINLEPVIGACLGVMLFRDPFGLGTIAGGGLIVAAAVVVSRRRLE